MMEAKATASRPTSLGSGVAVLTLVVASVNEGVGAVSVKLKNAATLPDKSPVKFVKVNLLGLPVVIGELSSNSTWEGVHTTFFIAAQSDAVPFRRPKGFTGSSFDMSAKVNVTDVIDVDGDGLSKENVNKKSFPDEPLPKKQFAVTTPLSA
jgi:hypothetical protein